MKKRRTAGLAIAGAVALGAIGVLAQSGGDYSFLGYAIPGGGGSSSGAGYVLDGSIGQPLAGRVSGSGYVMEGGILAGEMPGATFELYAPGLSRQP